MYTIIICQNARSNYPYMNLICHETTVVLCKIAEHNNSWLTFPLGIRASNTADSIPEPAMSLLGLQSALVLYAVVTAASAQTDPGGLDNCICLHIDL